MGMGGIKKSEKIIDVIYGRPLLINIKCAIFYVELSLKGQNNIDFAINNKTPPFYL